MGVLLVRMIIDYLLLLQNRWRRDKQDIKNASKNVDGDDTSAVTCKKGVMYTIQWSCLSRSCRLSATRGKVVGLIRSFIKKFRFCFYDGFEVRKEDEDVSDAWHNRCAWRYPLSSAACGLQVIIPQYFNILLFSHNQVRV